FFFFWFATALLDSRTRQRDTIVALLLAALLVFRAFRSDLASVSRYHYGDSLRIRGPFIDLGSNELAAFFVYSGLFFLFYALKAGALWFRGACLGGAGLYAYGVLYSYSRGGWLAYCFALSVATFIR